MSTVFAMANAYIIRSVYCRAAVSVASVRSLRLHYIQRGWGAVINNRPKGKSDASRWRGRSLHGVGVALLAGLLTAILAVSAQPAFATSVVPSPSSGSAGLVQAQAAAYRPFNAANARYNLSVRMGKNPSTCQAHHMIPQKFVRQAGVAGVNIHDPIHLVWWISIAGVPGNHQSKAAQYNQEWDRFFAANRAPTAAQIIAEKNRLNGIYRGYYRC